MPPRLAVMHHSSSFFPLDLRADVGEYAELVWVIDSSATPEGMQLLLRRIGPVVDTCGQNIEDTAAALTELGAEGIVSFVDDHIVEAAYLARLLGLRYHTPEVAGTLVNKQRQRAALDEAGIPGPSFWIAPPGLDGTQAAEFAEQVIYPAVVKPAEGSGSRNISLVHTRGELEAVLTDGCEPGLLVEQYMEDEPGHERWCASYLSVESVVSDGKVGHVAVTGRFPLAEPFRETGNFIPALYPADQLPELLALNDATIAALGITDSLTHIEIKLTPDGPRVIEVNGRLGGRPPYVLGAVSDVNLFLMACQVALGDPVEVDGLAPCDGVGFMLMLHAPMAAQRLDGVDGVHGADGVAAIEGVTKFQVHQVPGAPLDWREGTSGRIVTVHGAVADHAELAETVARVGELITITVDTPRGDFPTPPSAPGGSTHPADRSVESLTGSRHDRSTSTAASTDADGTSRCPTLRR